MSVGDVVTLTCQTKQDSTNPVTLTQWIKKIGNREIEIGTNNFINYPFNWFDRYVVDFNYNAATEVINMKLTITGELLYVPDHRHQR